MLLASLNCFSALLNNGGKGSFHIIPMYATSNGLNTQVTITNDFSGLAAVKIHVKEANNSQPIYSYNVYIEAGDTWTFALGDVATEEGSQTVHVTTDKTCPPFTPQITQYNTMNSTVINTNPSRVKNGHIEIIQMGVADRTNFGYLWFPATGLDQIFNCEGPENAFNTGGIWDSSDTYVNTNILPPNDSLMVEASILDISEGANYPIPVTSFSDFFEAGQSYHTRPESAHPTLDDAKAQATIWASETLRQLTFNSGREAVSALLLKDKLEVPFFLSENVAAISSISLLNIDNSNTNCEVSDGDTINGRFFHRSGYHDPSEDLQDTRLCHKLSVINMNTNRNIFDAQNHVQLNLENLTTDAGVFEINFPDPISLIGTDIQTQEQFSFTGLPFIGMIFNRATNANAAPGLLAQYGLTQPLSGKPTVLTINSSEVK